SPPARRPSERRARRRRRRGSEPHARASRPRDRTRARGCEGRRRCARSRRGRCRAARPRPWPARSCREELWRTRPVLQVDPAGACVDEGGDRLGDGRGIVGVAALHVDRDWNVDEARDRADRGDEPLRWRRAAPDRTPTGSRPPGRGSHHRPSRGAPAGRAPLGDLLACAYLQVTVPCYLLNAQTGLGPEKFTCPHCPAGSSVRVARSGSAASVIANAPCLPTTLKLTSPGCLSVVLMETLVMPSRPALLEYFQDVPDLFAFQPILVTGSTRPGGILTSATVELA